MLLESLLEELKNSHFRPITYDEFINTPYYYAGVAFAALLILGIGLTLLADALYRYFKRKSIERDIEEYFKDHYAEPSDNIK